MPRNVFLVVVVLVHVNTFQWMMRVRGVRRSRKRLYILSPGGTESSFKISSKNCNIRNKNGGKREGKREGKR